MRHEGEIDRGLRDLAQALQNFRQVSVSGHAVSLEIVARLGEQEPGLGLLAGAADPGFAVGNQVLAVDDPRFQQGNEPELNGRGIAPGRTDDARLADRLPVELRQSVRRFREQIRTRVGQLVPLLEHGRVGEAEIRCEIDHFDAGAHELPRLRHGDPMRRGEEDDMAAIEAGLFLAGELQAHAAAQVGKHVRDSGACLGPGGDGRKLGVGMLRQQAQQFHARITRSANDSDFDHD